MPAKVPYKQIKINLTPQNYAKIKALSNQYDMSMASLVRELLEMQNKDAPARKGGLKNDNNIPHELLYQIAKIGTNLNQISKHCNITRVIDRLVLCELVEIRKELQKLLVPPSIGFKNKEEI